MRVLEGADRTPPTQKTRPGLSRARSQSSPGIRRNLPINQNPAQSRFPVRRGVLRGSDGSRALIGWGRVLPIQLRVSRRGNDSRRLQRLRSIVSDSECPSPRHEPGRETVRLLFPPRRHEVFLTAGRVAAGGLCCVRGGGKGAAARVSPERPPSCRGRRLCYGVPGHSLLSGHCQAPMRWRSFAWRSSATTMETTSCRIASTLPWSAR